MLSSLICALFAVCAPVQPSASGPPTWAQTAPIAVPLVAKWEGLELSAYLDTLASPPVWTICYGETQGVRPGETRTRSECEAGLRNGLHTYWRDYRQYVSPAALRRHVAAPLDAAFTSLTWNIGPGNLRRSTAIRRLNDGDPLGACEALTWWNKAGGQVRRGLVNRREDEYLTCKEGLAQ